MPRLKNIKHEQLARNLLKTKFNQVEAYKATYNCKESSASSNANKAMVKYGVVQRAVEIANAFEPTKLESLIHSFSDDLTATKPFITKAGVEYTKDNAVILEAKKFLISKVHGLDREKAGGDTYNIDARQVNTTINDSNAMLGLCDRIDALNDNLKQARARREVAIEP